MDALFDIGKLVFVLNTQIREMLEKLREWKIPIPWNYTEKSLFKFYYTAKKKREENISSLSNPELFTLLQKGDDIVFEECEKRFQEGFFTEREKLYFLKNTIRSGRIDFLDKIIRYYYSIKEGFSIFSVPIPTFSPRLGENYIFPLVEIPLTGPIRINFDEIIDDVIYSGNVRVVDFFRSLYKIHILPEQVYNIMEGKDPVSLFSIMQRTKMEYYGTVFTSGNFDFILYYLSFFTIGGDFYKKTNMFERNLGNIPLINSLLPKITTLKELNKILQNKELENLPLTKRILEDYGKSVYLVKE